MRAHLSVKQRIIVDALKTVDTITLAEAVELIGGDIYSNKKFHVGNVLGNMVKQGLIQRLTNGVFTLPLQTEMKEMEFFQLES